MVDGDVAVGVPDIVPVVVSNDKPPGKAVLMDQLAAAPPVFVGFNELIVVPTVYVFVDGE